jgi:hypothetical protein
LFAWQARADRARSIPHRALLPRSTGSTAQRTRRWIERSWRSIVSFISTSPSAECRVRGSRVALSPRANKGFTPPQSNRTTPRSRASEAPACCSRPTSARSSTMARDRRDAADLVAVSDHRVTGCTRPVAARRVSRGHRTVGVRSGQDVVDAGRDARDEEGHLLARVAAGEYRDEEPGRRAATDPHRQSSIT